MICNYLSSQLYLTTFPASPFLKALLLDCAVSQTSHSGFSFHLQDMHSEFFRDGATRLVKESPLCLPRSCFVVLAKFAQLFNSKPWDVSLILEYMWPSTSKLPLTQSQWLNILSISMCISVHQPIYDLPFNLECISYIFWNCPLLLILTLSPYLHPILRIYLSRLYWVIYFIFIF